jgi:hypothetical protein
MPVRNLKSILKGVNYYLYHIGKLFHRCYSQIKGILRFYEFI